MLNSFIVLLAVVMIIIFVPKASDDWGYNFSWKSLIPLSDSISKKEDIVVVNPTSFNLSTGMGSIQEFRVTNQGSKSIYQIQIKITLEYGEIDLSSFKPLPTKSSGLIHTISNSTGGLQVGLDYVYMSGKDSTNNKPTTLFFIRGLDPKETLRFQWEIPAEKIIKSSKVNIQIVNFSFEPTEIIYHKKGVFMKVKPMESFKLESVEAFLNTTN